MYNEIIKFNKESTMRLLFVILFFISSLCADSGILDIQWPKPNAQHQKPSTPYPAVLTQGIKEVKLPVYIPNTFAYDEKMTVVADENFYTISFSLQGASVAISGDKTYQESISSPNPEFKKIMKSSPPVAITQAEGIMSAEFNRHGVNYAIEIECDSPKKDTRCTQPTLINELYSRLIMVGGRP
jgi:hypothetical protein